MPNYFHIPSTEGSFEEMQTEKDQGRGGRVIANGGHRMAISNFGSQEAVDWTTKILKWFGFEDENLPRG